MKFQRKKRRDPEIAMTSMVDVVLLLLFFFMLSTHFNQATAIKIRLPEANGAELDPSEKQVILVIDADGEFYLQDTDGLPHELINRGVDTLRRALAKQTERPGETSFIIQADGKAPHQSVMTALEAAGAVGFNHIRFAAEQRGETQ